MEKYLEAGRITNTHGIRGEVKIEVWVDSPEFLRKFKVLYIDSKPVKLLEGRAHKGFLLAKLEGFDDVNAAMTLKNKLVFINREDARLPRGSFFLSDLLGASVVDEQGEKLGELADIMELPAGNVYVVRGEREILIPAVPEFIKKTDIAKGVVTVRLIEGM